MESIMKENNMFIGSYKNPERFNGTKFYTHNCSEYSSNVELISRKSYYLFDKANVITLKYFDVTPEFRKLLENVFEKCGINYEK